MQRVARSIVIVTLSIGALIGAPTAQAGGLPIATKWAWIVVRDPVSQRDLAPSKDSGNSAGMTNHVTHPETGVYGVTFDGVGGSPGTFLVSPLSTTPRVCLVSEWIGTPGGYAQAEVHCYNLAGEPEDATFVVNWLTASGSSAISGDFSFGLNYSPTSNCGSPTQYYISGGVIETCVGDNSVSRWKLEPIGTTQGTAIVNAYAHRSSDGLITPGICDVVKFYPQPNISPGYTDEWVDVRCYDLNGTPDIYRENVVWYLKDMGLKGLDLTNVAYLFANKPTTASYSPPASKTFTSGGSITIKRYGIGQYKVSLPGMPKGGSVQVSAYLGSDTAAARVCVVGTITKDTVPTKVGVNCYKRNGTPADAKFTLAYAR